MNAPLTAQDAFEEFNKFWQYLAAQKDRGANMGDITIPDWIRVGTVYRLHYGPNHFANRTVHIRAIVDGDTVVCRHWSRKRQYWIYTVEHVAVVEEQGKSDHFQLVKVGKG